MADPAPNDVVIELTVGVAATVTARQLWPAFGDAEIASTAPAIPGMTRSWSQYSGTPTAEGLWLIRVDPGYGSDPNHAAWIRVVPAGPPPPPPHVRAPLGMRLDDTVDVVTAADGAFVMKLDAHVGQAASGLSINGNDVFAVNELRAIVPAWDDLDIAAHRVRWRGVVYLIDGPPMVRRQHGRDHHMTLRLTTQTA